jgi:hypothetical protein
MDSQLNLQNFRGKIKSCQDSARDGKVDTGFQKEIFERSRGEDTENLERTASSSRITMMPYELDMVCSRIARSFFFLCHSYSPCREEGRIAPRCVFLRRNGEK